MAADLNKCLEFLESIDIKDKDKKYDNIYSIEYRLRSIDSLLESLENEKYFAEEYRNKEKTILICYKDDLKHILKKLKND